VQQATLGDRVWEDSNGNGVQDSGEQGLNGVTVDLKDSLAIPWPARLPMMAASTASPWIRVPTASLKAPGGYAATAQNQGSNAAVDSDIDANGNSASVTLMAGQNNGNLDAGLVKFADLGDTVWNDANRNGLQDAGEAVVPM
jgi:hypothetical protein